MQPFRTTARQTNEVTITHMVITVSRPSENRPTAFFAKQHAYDGVIRACLLGLPHIHTCIMFGIHVAIESYIHASAPV